MLYYLVSALYVLVCLLLLLVVLLQQGKGGDMASAFGGGGSQTAFGARAGATVLTKATRSSACCSCRRDRARRDGPARSRSLIARRHRRANAAARGGTRNGARAASDSAGHGTGARAGTAEEVARRPPAEVAELADAPA